MNTCRNSTGGTRSSACPSVNVTSFVVHERVTTKLTNPAAIIRGPNLLSGPLLPFDDVLLTDVPCDNYDAMMVAEDGVTCELSAVDLCFDDATWVIDNHTCADFSTKPE